MDIRNKRHREATMSDEQNTKKIGSSPSRGTTFPQEIEGSAQPDTETTQKTAESEAKPMRFPKIIRHRKAEVTIYGKSENYPAYRIVWRANGRRLMKRFSTYSDALEAAEKLVKELAEGSQVAALTSAQANDALIAFERLQTHFRATGKRIGLADAVGQFCDVVARLGERSLSTAVDSYLRNEAVVKRKALSDAVTEYIASRKPLAKAEEGKRAKRSPVYEYNVGMWLKEFSAALPGHAVCDLTKDLLDVYMAAHGELSSKSRNDRRAVVKMFLRWCVAKDYLSREHRLFEATGLKSEDVELGEIDFYRPKELQAMLERASEIPAAPKEDEEVTPDFRALLPVLALAGLAGLRREEILRLDWKDCWRVPGKIEISARIAKGRKRRLVDIVPALASWISPFASKTGPVWGKSPDALEDALSALRSELEIPARRNGLRHAYVTYHLALHSNENLTAAEAGNSPTIIHEHYKGLATKAEAERWFAVAPVKEENVVSIALGANQP